MSVEVGNSLIDSFLIAIREKRDFSTITEKDKLFCEKIYNDFKLAQKIETKEDIFSFYLMSELDELVLDIIKRNSSFLADEFGELLSCGYYNNLVLYFQEIYSLDLKKVKWIYSALKYIDNKCAMLSLTTDVSYIKSSELYETYREVNEDYYNRFNQLNETSRDLISNVNNTQTELNNLSEKLDKQEKKAVENNVTILGIFVGIVAVLFGGISFLNLLSGSLLTANPIKSFMFITTVAIILFNSILALFYFISKITGKEIVSTNKCWVDCLEINCKNKCKCCSQYHKLKGLVCTIAQKSKFAFWSNVVMGECLAFLFSLYLVINQEWFSPKVGKEINIPNVLLALIIPVVSLIVIGVLTKPCQHHYEIIKENNKNQNNQPKQ